MTPLTEQESETLPDKLNDTHGNPAGTGDLGLALSGGGVRATLFSLGVIIGLIETQCHQRVRCVASVSGGSILNAALAHAPTLSTFKSIEEFEPLAEKLATSLAWRGAFAFDWRSLIATGWYLIRLLARAIALLAFALVTFSSALQENFNFLADFDYSQVPWLLVALIAATSLLVSAWFSRGLLQETKYRSIVSAVAAVFPNPDKPGLNVQEWGVVPKEGGNTVMHVLVATDLLSGEPIYFSGQFLYCRPYGWSVSKGIRTAEALYSSAAFPAVFPPKKLNLKRLNFQNGEMPGVLPRNVRLVDGGVYNNLGTDWFRVLKEHSKGSPYILWPFGELKVVAPSIDNRNVIVVNASAPSGRVQRLGPLTLARIMSVLYDNTVRPRVELLKFENRPFIDIKESPIQLARRLRAENGEDGKRAAALVRRLEGRTDQFWADFSHDTASTKTKLSRAGQRTGARLMLHGYLLSIVLLHVKFGAEVPEQIRGEEYFLSLVGRPGAVVEQESEAEIESDNDEGQ